MVPQLDISPAIAPDMPRLDTAPALANLAGDRELYAQVAEVFFEDMPSQLAALEGAMTGRDFPTAQRAAHTIKGMAATIGAERLRLIAYGLEQACKACDATAATASCPLLRDEYAAVAAELRAFIAV